MSSEAINSGGCWFSTLKLFSVPVMGSASNEATASLAKLLPAKLLASKPLSVRLALAVTVLVEPLPADPESELLSSGETEDTVPVDPLLVDPLSPEPETVLPVSDDPVAPESVELEPLLSPPLVPELAE